MPTRTPAPAPTRAFTLMERKFAPADDRLRSARRPRKADAGAARRSAREPPESAAHLHRDRHRTTARHHPLLPARRARSPFADAHDAALKAEFAQSNAAVIAALNDYLGWLKTDLLPRSNGDFRIGAETFSKKLHYDEMVDIPLDKLLEIGYADMHRNQQQFTQMSQRTRARKRHRAKFSKNLATIIPRPISCSMRSAPPSTSLLGFHPVAPHRHHSLRCAAHRRRDAALHARHHLGQHGLARPLRNACNRRLISTSRFPIPP